MDPYQQHLHHHSHRRPSSPFHPDDTGATSSRQHAYHPSYPHHFPPAPPLDEHRPPLDGDSRVLYLHPDHARLLAEARDRRSMERSFFDHHARMPSPPRVSDRIVFPSGHPESRMRHREIIARDVEPRASPYRYHYNHEPAIDDGVDGESTRIRTLEGLKLSYGWEGDQEDRGIVEEGGVVLGRKRFRTEENWLSQHGEADGAGSVMLEDYDGRNQRKAGFWDSGHGGHHYRDLLPYERELSEASSISLSHNRLVPDGQTPFTLGRQIPLPPFLVAGSSQVLPGPLNVEGKQFVGKGKKILFGGVKPQDDTPSKRKPSVLSRIHNGNTVWKRIDEPQRIRLSPFTQKPASPEQRGPTSDKVQLDVEFNSDVLAAKDDVSFSPSFVDVQNANRSINMALTPMIETPRKQRVSKGADGKAATEGIHKKNAIKRNSTLAVGVKNSQENLIGSHQAPMNILVCEMPGAPGIGTPRSDGRILPSNGEIPPDISKSPEKTIQAQFLKDKESRELVVSEHVDSIIPVMKDGTIHSPKVKVPKNTSHAGASDVDGQIFLLGTDKNEVGKSALLSPGSDTSKPDRKIVLPSRAFVTKTGGKAAISGTHVKKVVKIESAANISNTVGKTTQAETRKVKTIKRVVVSRNTNVPKPVGTGKMIGVELPKKEDVEQTVTGFDAVTMESNVQVTEAGSSEKLFASPTECIADLKPEVRPLELSEVDISQKSLMSPGLGQVSSVKNAIAVETFLKEVAEEIFDISSTEMPASRCEHVEGKQSKELVSEEVDIVNNVETHDNIKNNDSVDMKLVSVPSVVATENLSLRGAQAKELSIETVHHLKNLDAACDNNKLVDGNMINANPVMKVNENFSSVVKTPNKRKRKKKEKFGNAVVHVLSGSCSLKESHEMEVSVNSSKCSTDLGGLQVLPICMEEKVSNATLQDSQSSCPINESHEITQLNSPPMCSTDTVRMQVLPSLKKRRKKKKKVSPVVRVLPGSGSIGEASMVPVTMSCQRDLRYSIQGIGQPIFCSLKNLSKSTFGVATSISPHANSSNFFKQLEKFSPIRRPDHLVLSGPNLNFDFGHPDVKKTTSLPHLEDVTLEATEEVVTGASVVQSELFSSKDEGIRSSTPYSRDDNNQFHLEIGRNVCDMEQLVMADETVDPICTGQTFEDYKVEGNGIRTQECTHVPSLESVRATVYLGFVCENCMRGGDGTPCTHIERKSISWPANFVKNVGESDKEIERNLSLEIDTAVKALVVVGQEQTNRNGGVDTGSIKEEDSNSQGILSTLPIGDQESFVVHSSPCIAERKSNDVLLMNEQSDLDDLSLRREGFPLVSSITDRNEKSNDSLSPSLELELQNLKSNNFEKYHLNQSPKFCKSDGSSQLIEDSRTSSLLDSAGDSPSRHVPGTAPDKTAIHGMTMSSKSALHDHAISEKLPSFLSHSKTLSDTSFLTEGTDELARPKDQQRSAISRVLPHQNSHLARPLKRVAPSQKAKHKTWRRTEQSTASPSIEQLKPHCSSSLQKQSPKRNGRLQGPYVRKGNSLIRKSDTLNATPQSSVSHASSQNNNSETNKITTFQSKYGRTDNVISFKQGQNSSIERPKTPPLPLIMKLPSHIAGPSDHPQPPLEGCLTLSCSEHQCNSLKECDTELVHPDHPGYINTENCKNSSKGVTYIKHRYNQLVAATGSGDNNLSLYATSKVHSVPSSATPDNYYMRTKNQLIRDASSDGHLKQEMLVSTNILNNRDQRATKHSLNDVAVPFQGRLNKAKEKKFKRSRFSLVWCPRGAQPLQKDATSRQENVLPRILPWKRSLRSSHSKIPNPKISDLQSLKLIRDLQLSRKRDTIYTVSKGGYSLRKSGVLSIGGTSLKWSKSIERRSKKASEEATLAVAEAERKKREENGSSRTHVNMKSRNHMKAGKRIFRIGTMRYEMDSSRKTLVRISDVEASSTNNQQSEQTSPLSFVPRRLVIGNEEYIRIGNGSQLVRDPKKLVRILASEKIRWSLHTARLRLAKKHQFCQFFTRFGKCNKESGKCPYIHDPTKVAICTKFLKGLCSSTSCRLTHEVIPERMPDCSYFLQGLCTNASCPYRHVKVNPSACVCEGFLKGYCAEGDECRRKHSYVCPDFEAVGKCLKGSTCKLHHPKHPQKPKKRKRNEVQTSRRVRYFGSNIAEAHDPRLNESSENRFDKSGDLFFCDGRFAEYISLDVECKSELVERNDLERSHSSLSDSDVSEKHSNDLDALIKPIRIMNKIPA